uniref:Putative secreted protein n=1 Tax=Anopheles darlingi TaxID=43151 RepID=A0A2M4D1S8_ANODA
MRSLTSRKVGQVGCLISLHVIRCSRSDPTCYKFGFEAVVSRLYCPRSFCVDTLNENPIKHPSARPSQTCPPSANHIIGPSTIEDRST